jgi:hypothetical protein
MWSVRPAYEHAPGLAFRDPELQALTVHYSEQIRRANKILGRFKWTALVRDFDFYMLQGLYTWLGDDDDSWEGMALQWLHSQLRDSSPTASAMRNFRRCVKCSSWFYAMANQQRFCLDKCRKAFAADDPGFKEKRRNYMREKYRPMVRAAEERSIRQARRALRKTSKEQ